MIEGSFDVPFIADLALREKQIQQSHRPIVNPVSLLDALNKQKRQSL
jgi:hypothetical protein